MSVETSLTWKPRQSVEEGAAKAGRDNCGLLVTQIFSQHGLGHDKEKLAELLDKGESFDNIVKAFDAALKESLLVSQLEGLGVVDKVLA